MRVTLLEKPPEEEVLAACVWENLALGKRQAERRMMLCFVWVLVSMVGTIVTDFHSPLHWLGWISVFMSIIPFGAVAVLWNEKRAQLTQRLSRSMIRSLKNGTLREIEI